MARGGIHRYESRRLLLYTDIDPAIADTLPPLMDAAFNAWEGYFGPLPPDRAGTDFQMTGYLMRDQQLFREAGLLPLKLPVFLHGQHRGQEFWMNDQEFDYYRRHLMIHEGTHCFMEAMRGIRGTPLWYLEGLAELFGTHRRGEAAQVEFRVMPEESASYVGFGRIQMIQREIADGRLRTIADLGQLAEESFGGRSHDYAWSWALCKFLDTHPRYQEPFRHLAKQYVSEGFHTLWQRLFAANLPDVEAEWELFVRHLEYGFDIAAAAIQFVDGEPLTEDQGRETTAAADRGWQSTGIVLQAGEAYTVTADGQVAMAQQPRPWISEPQGISIRYAEGSPIGRLRGRMIGAPHPEDGRRRVGDLLDVGRACSISPEFTGTLYVCVNDFWSERADNTGSYTVKVQRGASGNRSQSETD